MTRKQSNTVDYFPHTARSGKTLFVLESKFGNDAYAFWFKLLELLSISENHFYDCNNPTNWEYLIAKTRSDDISATEMLAILAKLGNIDAELWENKIIWCQALVDNIADVYKNRKRSLPQKPKIQNNYCRNATTADISTVEMQENQQNVDYQGQNTVEKRQSKVNKSKVK